MSTSSKTFLINSPTRTSFSFEQQDENIDFHVSLVNPKLHAYYLYSYVIFVIFVMFFYFYIGTFLLLLIIPLIIFLNIKKKEKKLTSISNRTGTNIGKLTYNLKEFTYVDLQTQKSYEIKTQKYEILYNNEVFKIAYPKPDSDYTGFDVVFNEETIAQVYYSKDPGQKGQFFMTLLSEKYEIPFLFVVSIIIVSEYLK